MEQKPRITINTPINLILAVEIGLLFILTTISAVRENGMGIITLFLLVMAVLTIVVRDNVVLKQFLKDGQNK